MKVLLIYLYFFIPPFQTPDDGWAAIADWMAAYLNDLIIEGMKAVATTFWYLEKVAAGITRFLTEQDMWELILDSTLGSIRETMPDILSGLIFSNNGAGGLLYLALFMAGLLMIIPNMSHVRLVDHTRVITWAIIITVLFLSASNPWGYDLIGLLEQMRAGAVQVVIDTAAEEGDLDALVAQPMMATETDLENYSFVLPEDFEEEYYPEPEDDDYEERTITFIDSPFFTWQMNFEVESEDSQNERREKAEMGLAISGLTLMPGVVLLMFGFIFATLTASALILILFFLVSLPLGFFEFGAAILNGIVKQYAYLWAVTLLAIVLPGILIAAETLAYPDSGPPAPEQIMTFIPILVVVTIATSYVSAMATSAMTDTFSMISTSISASMAPLNYGGTQSVPKSGTLEGGVSGAASIVGTAALAAVTGGASAALMAGGGALLSKTGGGETAGALATGLAGEKASVFATAAKGRGAATTAQVAGSNYRRKKRTAAQSFSRNTSTQGDEIPEEERNQVNTGSYLTLDTDDLDRAEKAFQAEEYTIARHHLTRAFGSPELANQVMNQYRQHGQKGMRKVRAMVKTAQKTALNTINQKRPLFNAKGQLSDDFRKQAWRDLERRPIINTTNEEDTALSAQIAGAIIRQPEDIGISRQLAQHITQNPEAEHPLKKDAAAAFALHDLATSQGWGEQHLEALFVAATEARTMATQLGHPYTAASIANQMKRHGEFANTSPETRARASRLARLVMGFDSRPPNLKQEARKLTQKVIDPSSPHLATKNQAAEASIQELNELATEQGWGENELDALFETTLEVRGSDYEGPLNRHIANQALLKKGQHFTIGAREDREKGAALAVGIAAGTMPAPPIKPRTKPTTYELTQKALHPDSNQVLIRDEKTQKNLGKLNKLATDENWTEQELEPIFSAATDAIDNNLDSDHLSYIANELHEQGIPVDDKKIRAADLALKIQGGVMLAPQVAQATAAAQDELEKQAAKTVLLQTQQIQEQTPNWFEQEQQAGQTLAVQTQQIQNEIQEQQTNADRASLKERQQQEIQQQEHIMAPLEPEWDKLPPQPEWNSPPEGQEWYGPPEGQEWYGPPEEPEWRHAQEMPPEGREGGPEGQGRQEGAEWRHTQEIPSEGQNGPPEGQEK